MLILWALATALAPGCPQVSGPSLGSGWACAESPFSWVAQALVRKWGGWGEGGSPGVWPWGPDGPQPAILYREHHVCHSCPLPRARLSHCSLGFRWCLNSLGGCGATRCPCKADCSFLEPGAAAGASLAPGTSQGVCWAHEIVGGRGLGLGLAQGGRPHLGLAGTVPQGWQLLFLKKTTQNNSHPRICFYKFLEKEEGREKQRNINWFAPQPGIKLAI